MPQNATSSTKRIAIHFLMLIGAVVIYNRLIYALHTVSGNKDFSTWAAPLYAFAQPIPKITVDVLLRWITPLVVAGAWMAIVAKWMRAKTIGTMTLMRITVGVVLILNITTAMMDQGIKSIAWPFSVSQEDFYPDAAHVTDPIQLLRDYPTLNLGRHPRTHPPGGVLLLWAVRRTIGDGVMTASLFAIVVTALTLVPATLLARRLIGERATFIFVALYVLTPNLVIFGATSMDGVFAFFLGWTAYFFFSAAIDPLPARRGLWRGINLGVWIAISTFFTYASVALVALMVVWWKWQTIGRDAESRDRANRIFALLAVAAITVVACFGLLFLFTGCNILACVRASMRFDAGMMHAVRMQYFDQSITNFMGFIVGSGLIASTLWLRDAARDFSRPLNRPPIAACLSIAVVILSFSTLFTRELERVWMFLTPLLLMGAARDLDELIPESARRLCVVGAMVLMLAQTWLTQLLLYTLW